MTATNFVGQLADQVESGALVEAGDMAAEAGFNSPVLLTRAAWERYVSWTEEDGRATGHLQDQAGRLWDVLWMSRLAIRSAGRIGRAQLRITVDFLCVSRDPALRDSDARPAQVEVFGRNLIEESGVTRFILICDVDEGRK